MKQTTLTFQSLRVIAAFMALAIGFTSCCTKKSSYSASDYKTDSLMLSKFFRTGLSDKQGYNFLHTLCKSAGKRITGSPLADTAVRISYDYLKTIADTVYLQDVMVPHWVRGTKETAWIYTGGEETAKTEMRICALGGSIGTGPDGLRGKVIEVGGIDSIKKMKRADIEGKIVFYNGHFDDGTIETFDGYDKCFAQRWAGAMEAGKKGAIGVIVRSLNPSIDEFPHTGNMGYADSIKKIPAVALATIDANLLSETLKKDPTTEFYFRTTSETLPDVPSHSIIAELRGSKFPDQYIVVGGHIDAWDMAEGAHDDGAGVTEASEVIRLMKQCGYKPLHTIRVVFFMNEENGGKGANKYAEWVTKTKQKHLFALESDEGGFTPRGFTFEGGDTVLNKFLPWKPLLEKFNCGELEKGASGADIGKLRKISIVAGLHPDSERYFDFHHAATDVFEAVNPRELELGGAACASLLYLVDAHW